MQKIKKGDKVQVMLGKDQGKQAQVERISIKDEKVYLAGINVYKRHVKGRDDIEGGIIEMSKPLNISNVQLVCPNCNKPTRVGFLLAKDGKGKSRVCRKCNKEI